MNRFATLIFLFFLSVGVHAENIIDLDILVSIVDKELVLEELVSDSNLTEEEKETVLSQSPTGFLGLGNFFELPDIKTFFQDVNSDFDYEKYVKTIGLPCSDNITHRCIDFNVSIREQIDYDRCVTPIKEGGIEYPAEVCIAGPIAIKDHNLGLMADAIDRLEKEKALLEEQTNPRLARKIENLEETESEQHKREEATRNSIYLIAIILLAGGIAYLWYLRNKRESGEKPPEIFDTEQKPNDKNPSTIYDVPVKNKIKEPETPEKEEPEKEE